MLLFNFTLNRPFVMVAVKNQHLEIQRVHKSMTLNLSKRWYSAIIWPHRNIVRNCVFS